MVVVRPQMQSVKRLARRAAGPGGNRTVKWVPPGLLGVRRFLRRGRGTNEILSPPEHPTPTVDILFPRRNTAPHWISVSKIVNRFGQSFTAEQHHFVRYLESGFDNFELFYWIHQPKTALQARFIFDALPGPSPPNWQNVPWEPAPLAQTDTPKPNPVFFGPASDLDIATEAARIDQVRHSIEKYGFLKGRAVLWGGPITSQIFYRDNSDFRIVIVHGNHRTAVLAHLGWNRIPVRPEEGYHPVRLRDLDEWPGVVDGRFSRETARAMFEALFRPIRQQLLPGW